MADGSTNADSTQAATSTNGQATTSPQPKAAAETAPELPPPQSEGVQPPPTHTAQAEDRSELLQRARAFLNSPQVRHEDITAKRQFLVEKGLREAEIETLLHELVRHFGSS